MKPIERSRAIKAGIFLFVLMALFLGFTAMMGIQNSLFDSKIHIFAKVANSQGLKLGAAVLLDGVKVGRVETIEFTGINAITLDLIVTEKHARWIKKDSRVAIKTQGVLGDKLIEIQGGTDRMNSVVDGDYLMVDNLPSMTEFMNKGEDIMETASSALQKLNHLLDQANQGAHVQTMLMNMNQSTARLNTILESIEKRDVGKTLDRVNAVSKNVADITDRIQKGPGSLHGLIYDDTVHEDLKALLGGAQRNKILNYFIRESIKNSEKVKR